MKLSKYQEAVQQEFLHGTGNVEIQACAGSGKTTTLVNLLSLTPENAQCVFVAFSKAIAEELKTRVPANTHAATIHSVGMSIVRKHNHGKVFVDNWKIKKIMDTMPALEITKGMLPTEKSATYKARGIIEGMIEISKATMVDYTKIDEVAKICDMYNVEFSSEHFAHYTRVLEKSIENTYVIDYNDMIYLPVVKNMAFPTWDYVFVDECQDLNRAQIDFVLRMKKSTGRIFTVGDKNQSIFGFRGADSQAMARLKEALNSKSLPLSICYRCPPSHIALAKEIVPEIESFDNHPGGNIHNIKANQLLHSVNDGDLILCRVNAHLVTTALNFISNGKKATIKGRDIAQNIISIIRNLKANTIDELYINVDKWASDQIEILLKRKATSSAIDHINDKADVIKAVADQCKSVQNVINKIESLFSDDNGHGVILSTVHRAKGLEANNVFIIKPELIPLVRKSQTDWEIEQEKNIQYVAYTRAKKNLTFVNS